MSETNYDGTILDPIKHIIESHKHAVSGGEVLPGDYWRKRFPSKFSNHTNDPVAADHLHHNHHIGQWWAGHGMKVVINDNSMDPKSRELISVMNFIKESLLKDSKEFTSLQEIYGGIFERDSDPKKLSSMKQTYLMMIKAVAVSLFAEADGNSKKVMDLLKDGGMDVVKKFNVESMKNFLEHLKDISEEDDRKRQR